MTLVSRLSRLLLVLAAVSVLSAADSWTLSRSGPFDVYASGGNKAARETLNEIEQLRNAISQVIGKQDLRPVWQIRVVLFESARDAARFPSSSFKRSRDALVIALTEGAQPPLAEFTRILVEANAARMPAPIENGLYALFSTLSIQGTRVSLGEPVPPDRRTRDWALMHMLTATPEYGGKSRVLFSNLEQGADWVASYKNAFAKTPAQIDAEVDRYLKAGVFGARPLSGAPINPQRDFPPRRVEPALMQVILGDLLDGDAAQAEYRAVLNQHGKIPEALEGLGLYADAIEAGSRSANCYLKYGAAQNDKVKAREALRKAMELNPRWAEPLFRLAELESSPAAKAGYLKKAADLEPRNIGYWQALAETSLAATDFNEAGRAWAAAERAAATAEERERLRIARRQVETERSEYTAKQQKNEQEKIEKLKDEMMAKIHEAEKRAKRDDPAAPSDRKVVDWWDDSRPKARLVGTLQRLDCTRGLARLVIQTPDGKQVQFVIRDPSKVVLADGGEQMLGCGPLKPPRSVLVEYFKQPDEKLKTLGEVSVVEFQ